MRRFLSILLSVLLVLSMFTFSSISADSNLQKNYAGMGNYTVSLNADPKTNTVPNDFGTPSANGKVWTDKSVGVNQNNFEVTLSALAQEYISESNETATSSIAADVVMVLDLSASMQNSSLTMNNVSMTRTKAMVKAVNEAIEIIMAANDKNRVLIYTYQSNSTGANPVINEFLPLGHYENTSWSATEVFSGNSGKYLDYSARITTGTISTSNNLKKDGNSFSKKSISTGSGTCTQHGILKGVQALANAISQEEKTVDRKPYVLLFTDGAPGNATKSWYNSASNSCDLDHENNGSAEISALTILTSAYMKDVVSTAYNTYNGKDVGVEWFNIGLGVGNAELGTLFLQPWKLETSTSNNAKNIRSKIANYTSGQYSAYSAYADSYVYTVDAYIVDGGDDLENAFLELANKIQEETKVITSPIISVEGAVSDLTFTDVIGEGMTVSDIYLCPDDNTKIFGVLKDGVYTFNGYDITVSITTDSYGRSVLTWNIPADEVAIFAFANRNDPEDGNYIEKDPIRLTYNVRVKDPDNYEGATLYESVTATAEYSVPSDNTYYFNEDGSMKTAPFETQLKTENATGIVNYSALHSTQSIENGVFVKTTLGNNGKITAAASLVKSAEDPRVEIGTAVTFTLAVTNKAETKLSNVIVSDTLPEGLSYKTGSVKNATVEENGLNLSFTIPSIAVGETISVTYDVILASNVEAGDTFTNTAAISRINSVDVYGPADTSTTITSYKTYKVVYEWSGTIPSSALIPVDANRYITGENYFVDNTYTAQTQIENKDTYGNVIERYTFSGWTDPNNNVMGESDVIISGVWNYESFSYSNNKVIYSWSGDVPPNKTIPTDNNLYIKNQPYEVDNTYTAATEILTYDEFGNVNGKYTFSGWADPNHGIMGESDVTILGVWNYETKEVAKHKVNYVWSGTIPSGQIIPTNNNEYVKNQRYEVDTTFTSNTEILTYDEFGNVNGKYTFSGWTDPNNGVMADADVTIAGVWNYETVEVSKHKVNYVWTGSVPSGQTIPTNNNEYVKNQKYEVDTTFTNETKILTYDEFGNVNGKYTFSGWTDPNSGVMGESDVTIVGVWAYETIEVAKHKVNYVWSGTIPSGQTIPTNNNEYVKNQPYEVDGVYTATTEILTRDEFGNVNGKYTFSGWTDPNNGVMGESDVTILGVWNYETIEVSKHKVYYVWTGDIPAGETLPSNENEYVKNQTYPVDTTYTSNTEILTFDVYGNNNGKYTFSGWTDPNNAVMGDSDVTINGVWQFEEIAVLKHRVYYSWSGNIPEGVIIPSNDNLYVKNQNYTVDAVFTAATEILTYDEFGNINGKYTFSGWTDPNNGIMGDSDVTVLGVWEFKTITVPQYKVNYVWSGDVPSGKEIPTNDNLYYCNQPYSVDKTYTNKTEVLIYDEFGNLNGRYSFSGWVDPNNEVMGNADVTIVGVWKFESVEVLKHKVNYVWTGTIPNGQTIPTNNNEYAKNQKYEVDTTFTNKTEILTYDEFGNVNGKYTFSGWTDPNNGVMADADVTISGVWSYETIAVEKHRVYYSWSGEIPSDVIIPSDENSYAKNQGYLVDETFTSNTEILTHDEFGNVNGKYTFSGWTDPNNGVMGESDVTILGVWNYETITPPRYNVYYEWTGAIPPLTLLPVDGNTYVKNQGYSVDATFTSNTEILTKDEFGNVNGKYTFSGWTDPNNGVMGESDVTIIGVWTYETIEVEKHKVNYVWSGTIPSGQVIPTDSNDYVKNQSYTVDATYTSNTEILTYDAYGNNNGKYTFSGWTDPNNGVMGDSDVTVLGVWTFEAITVPQYKVNYVWSGDVPSGKEIPTNDNLYYCNQPYMVDKTYTDKTEVLTYDEYGNPNGRYIFSGWADPNNEVMGNADITILGVWNYETIEVLKHKVNYVWTGAIPSGQIIPTNNNEYAKNQTYPVDETFTDKSEVLTYDEFGNVNGRYSFSGWNDPNNKVMGEKDVTISGVWSYESVTVEKHRVYYSWSGEIPSDVIIPSNENSYAKNQGYLVDETFTEKTEISTYDEFGNVNGKYTFSGWTDPNNGVMGDSDVTILGVWNYETITPPSYKVYYEWTGTVPPLASLPIDGNTYIKNQIYSVDEYFTNNTEILTYDEFGKVNGKYTFSRWTDPNSGVMGESDVTISGVWKYEKISVIEETPSQPKPPVENEVPNTGDNFKIGWAIVMLALSMVLMIITINPHKKKA